MAQKITRLSAQHIGAIAKAAGAGIHDIKREIASGGAELYQFDRCFFCFRVEQFADFKELVIVAAEGENLASHCPQIIKQARALGCKSIRFHTANNKLGAAMRRFNAAEVERVYKVEV